MTIRVLSPEGNTGKGAVSMAASPDVLSGSKIAVLDNGKPGAAVLLTRVAEQLAARSGAEYVGAHRKRTAATPCEEDLLERVAQQADVVLTGMAD